MHLFLLIITLFSSQSLYETLDYFGIKHTSMQQIVDETQEKWLRDPKKERWEMEQQSDPNPEKTYCLFTKLNMTEKATPGQNCYDYALILGATLNVMRERFYSLKMYWDQGVRFNQLVVLVGDRPRDSEIENLQELTTSVFPFKEGWHFSGNLPKNETELAKLAFEQLDLPCQWNAITTFDDTPLKEGQKRPTTKDTFEHWLLSDPKGGSCLILSSQPFILRQDLTAKKMLGPKFSVDTVGKGISFEEYQKHPKALPIMLDELARILYQIKS